MHYIHHYIRWIPERDNATNMQIALIDSALPLAYRGMPGVTESEILIQIDKTIQIQIQDLHSPKCVGDKRLARREDSSNWNFSTGKAVMSRHDMKKDGDAPH